MCNSKNEMLYRVAQALMTDSLLKRIIKQEEFDKIDTLNMSSFLAENDKPETGESNGKLKTEEDK